MLHLEFRHVDVFSTHALSGNGLVVVLDAGGVDGALMLAVTREMRQFETTFVTRLYIGARSAVLRIFTEDEELDFAGHPVLGAAAVLHDLAGAGSDEQRWTLEVGGRVLDVRTCGRDGHVVATMDQGPPTFGPAIDGELAAAYRAALSLSPDQVRADLPMQMVSTGLPYLIVPVTADGLDRVRIAHPDFESLLARCGAKFAYILDPDRPEGRTWDNAGRVEDMPPEVPPGRRSAISSITACCRPGRRSSCTKAVTSVVRARSRSGSTRATAGSGSADRSPRSLRGGSAPDGSRTPARLCSLRAGSRRARR